MLSPVANAGVRPSEDRPVWNPATSGNKSYGPGAKYKGKALPGPFPGGRWCHPRTGLCAVWSNGKAVSVKEWGRRNKITNPQWFCNFERTFESQTYSNGKADFECRDSNI